jgi:SAM-dependent methyltransferase
MKQRLSNTNRPPSARYYSEVLSGSSLRRCYEVAPPRVSQALEAEIEFVLQHTTSSDRVLELGCGFGRVLAPLSAVADEVIGIDNSLASLRMARETMGRTQSLQLAAMDAADLGMPNEAFDVVVCIQNGLSAFMVDQTRVVREAVRVTRPGGLALFSSYSEAFWTPRLQWFRIQSDEGLLGEIDEDQTGDGVIVCKDGFRATTLTPDDFRRLASATGCTAELVEVDDSTLFCILPVT